MKNFILIIIASFFLFSCSDDIKIEKKAIEKVTLEKLDEKEIPKNIDECIRQLDSILSDSLKNSIKLTIEEDFVNESHFGLGMYLRNYWRLWESLVLTKYFNELGIYHADDMSAIILTSYHRYLNKKDINFDEQTEFYQKFLKSEENQ